ncbi:hypothetical protein ACULNC_01125 [Shigella flexneri]
MQIAINVQQGLANFASRRSMRADTEDLPCAVPITPERGWQMMVSTSYVLAAY